MNSVPRIASPYRPTPTRQADRQRAQHHHGVLRILDLRSVANQVGGADDAEGARQAGADDQHDQRADDGQDDLRLDDGGLPDRRAPPARAERQRGAEHRRQRQPSQRGDHFLLEVVGHAGLIDRLGLRRQRRDCWRLGLGCGWAWAAARTGIRSQPAANPSASLPSIRVLAADHRPGPVSAAPPPGLPRSSPSSSRCSARRCRASRSRPGRHPPTACR